MIRGGLAGHSQVVPLRVPLRVQGILIESILMECSVVDPLTTSQRGTGAGQRPRRSGPSGGPSVPLQLTHYFNAHLPFFLIVSRILEVLERNRSVSC